MIAKVIIDILNAEVDKIFDYLVPQDLNICPGDRVLLPFGSRTIEGYVLALAEASELSPDKLKPIIKKMDDISIIKPELLALIQDLKSLFHLRTVDGIRLVVPAQIRGGKVKKIEQKILHLNPDDNLVNEYFSKIRANAKNEIGAIAFMRNTPEKDSTTLSKQFTSATINKLIKNNSARIDKTLFWDIIR